MDYDVAGALSEVQAETQAPAEGVPSQGTTEQQAERMLDLKWGGETKQFPQSKVIDYAQQGFDYNKKMADFNSQKRVWESEQSKMQQNFDQLKSRYDYLDQVDKYAEQNPQWLQSVQQAYAQATGQQAPVNQQVLDQANPLHGTVTNLQSELTGIKEMLSSQAEQEQTRKQAEEDAALDTLIGEYKGKNTTFDWETSDPITGQNLEQKIIQHAMDQGIKNFSSAANDFLHDQFLAQARGEAKETVGKDIQKKTLLGLGPKTEQPTQGLQAARNVGQVSYEQLATEALKELGG